MGKTMLAQVVKYGYGVMRSIDEFNRSSNEFEESSGSTEDMLNRTSEAVLNEFTERMGASSPEDLIERYVPAEYKPFAKGLMTLDWDQSVDMVSTFAKEYGKDDEGEPMRTGDVLKSFMNRFMSEYVKDTMLGEREE